MKTKLLLVVLSLSSFAALAAPPPPPGRTGGPGPGPGRFERGGPEGREERFEARERRGHMLALVAIAEALELTEAEALKLSEKMKGVEEKRRPVRQAMFEAMRSLKDAADGDQAALGQVDANIQKVLDGRAQMAAMDKELFQVLAQGQTPQKRAKLALTLARLSHEMKGMKKGRRHP